MSWPIYDVVVRCRRGIAVVAEERAASKSSGGWSMTWRCERLFEMHRPRKPGFTFRVQLEGIRWRALFESVYGIPLCISPSRFPCTEPLLLGMMIWCEETDTDNMCLLCFCLLNECSTRVSLALLGPGTRLNPSSTSRNFTRKGNLHSRRVNSMLEHASTRHRPCTSHFLC